MKRIVRLTLVALVAAASFAPSSAWAVTIRDLIELTRAGLSEEVLIALVETDTVIPTLTPADLVALKDGAVSDKVVIAMLRRSRLPVEPPVAPPAPDPGPDMPDTAQPPPAPQVVVVETPVLVQTPVFYPVFVSAGWKGHHFPRHFDGLAPGHFLHRGRTENPRGPFRTGKAPQDFGRFINVGGPTVPSTVPVRR
jgi:hypothetical protein